MKIKVGRNGHFLACSGYPDCTYSRDYVRNEKGEVKAVEIEAEETSDKLCDKCGKPMVIKPGKFGKFFACSGYPDCKNTFTINDKETHFSGQNAAQLMRDLQKDRAQYQRQAKKKKQIKLPINANPCSVCKSTPSELHAHNLNYKFVQFGNCDHELCVTCMKNTLNIISNL